MNSTICIRIAVLVSFITLTITFYGQKVSSSVGNPGIPESTSGFCNVPDGYLYYEDCGQGMPLIFIHAGGLDSRMWDPQFYEFAKKFRVIRYDARLHGKSNSEVVAFSHADDLAILMDSLHIKQAVVLGLSMGGYIAIDFALKYPEKVIAMIPVSPGLTGYDFKDPQVVEDNKKMNAARTLEETVEYMLRPWFDGPNRTPNMADPALRAKVGEMYLDFLLNYKRGLTENRSEPPAIERLSEIRKPVLTIVGDLDQPGILEIAGMIEKQMTDAKMIVIKGAAHMVNLEKPMEFELVVTEFLTKLF